MVEITVGKNDEGKRLDRFLKKYYPKAALSHIYKMIRKDVKINGRRGKEESILSEGDVLTIYITGEDDEKLREKPYAPHAKRQFDIAYEDENALIVVKPFGLLTHGDKTEKKNTLANQVLGYLTETGAYSPKEENTFVPAPANRLDRNTTGLVIFGKTSAALKEFNALLKRGEGIDKYYLTILAGNLKEPCELMHIMTKDEQKNRVEVTEVSADASVVSEAAHGRSTARQKLMKTYVKPIAHGRYSGKDYTLAEVKLFTGRTHQIRAQLAGEGYPLIGDPKYGNSEVNREMKRMNGLPAQLLHSYKLVFSEGIMAGKTVTAKPSKSFERICNELIGRDILSKLLG